MTKAGVDQKQTASKGSGGSSVLRLLVKLAFFFLASVLVYHASCGTLTDSLRNLPHSDAALRSRVWRNYENAFFFGTAEFAAPRNVGEIQALIQRARTHGLTLKVVGSGHSWMDIGVPEDIQVSMFHFNRVLHVDTTHNLVRVQAGATLETLQNELAKHGLTLSVLPSVVEPTVGGILTAAVHGSGLHHGVMADQLVELELVTGAAEIKRFSADDKDVWNGVRVPLGALGIITQATLRVVPLSNMHEVATPVPQDVWQSQEALNRLANENKDFCKVWFPPVSGMNASGLVFTGHLTAESPRSTKPRWLTDTEHTAFEMLQNVAAWVPALAAPILKFVWPIASAPVDRVTSMPKVFAVQSRLAPHTEAEYSVPIEHAAAAIRAIQSFIDRTQFPVNHVIEVRFVKRDELWLSPDYQRDAVHFSLLLYNPGPDRRDAYFRGLEEALKPLGVRAHWAKWFYLSTSELRAAYPRFDDFARLRQQLDPDGVFATAFVRRVFGLPERASRSTATANQRDL